MLVPFDLTYAALLAHAAELRQDAERSRAARAGALPPRGQTHPCGC